MKARAKKPGRPHSGMERLVLNLRLPPGTADRMKRLAAADMRPLASWAALALIRASERPNGA